MFCVNNSEESGEGGSNSPGMSEQKASRRNSMDAVLDQMRKNYEELGKAKKNQKKGALINTMSSSVSVSPHSRNQSRRTD